MGSAPEAGAADERKGLSELGYSVVKEHRITGLSPLKVLGLNKTSFIFSQCWRQSPDGAR